MNESLFSLEPPNKRSKQPETPSATNTFEDATVNPDIPFHDNSGINEETSEQADESIGMVSSDEDENDSSTEELFEPPSRPYRLNRNNMPIPKLQETRDPISMRKDNLVVFATQNGQPCDQGSQELVNAGALPKLSDLTLGRARPIKQRNGYIIALAIKENLRTFLDKEILTEALASLADVICELDLRSISISKTATLDNIPWKTIENLLQTYLNELSANITVCLHLVQIPPENLRQDIITENHTSAFGGHKGVTKTYNRIRQNYYWKSLKEQVQLYVRRCIECQRKKLVRTKTRQPMIITDTPGTAFDKIGLDIVGPLPTTKKGNTYILTIQDLLTKYSLAIPLPQTSSQNIAEAFVNQFICRFGSPKAMLTDQGSNFISSFMKAVARRFRIKQYKTTTYHPQSNGSLERSHLVLTEYLKMYVNQHQEWDTWLNLASFSYNTSIHESTKFSPHELVFGKPARVPSSLPTPQHIEEETYSGYLQQLNSKLSGLQCLAREHLVKSKIRSKRYYDQRVNQQHFSAGDNVFVLREPRKIKLDDQYTGPHRVLEIMDDGNLRVAWHGGSKIVHPNKVRLSYIRDQDPGRSSTTTTLQDQQHSDK